MFDIKIFSETSYNTCIEDTNGKIRIRVISRTVLSEKSTFEEVTTLHLNERKVQTEKAQKLQELLCQIHHQQTHLEQGS